jgi:hypothetical protein
MADSFFDSVDRPALLGRVFLTPTERLSLDNRRLHPEVEIAQATGAVTAQHESVGKPPSRIVPMGYIKRSSGTALLWRDGEFVPLQGDEKIPALKVQELIAPTGAPQYRETPANNADPSGRGTVDEEGAAETEDELRDR